MRVLTVTNMYPTPSEPWFGSFVKDQIAVLRRLGVWVDVLSFDGRRDWRRYGTAVPEVRRLVSQSDFDVVHAHYGLTGAVALCQRQVPVVTTFHGSDSAQVPWQRRVSDRGTPKHPNLRGSGERTATRSSDALVLPAGGHGSVSGRSRMLVQRSGGNTIHLPAASRARSNPIKRADLFDRVVELVRRSLPDVRGISLEGYSRHEVANIMNAVDVVLLTSDSEGSSVAVKEALACATPVVSVPAGDVPGVLAGLPGCAIAPRDPRELADAVLAALTADAALRRRALDFSYDRVAVQLIEVYLAFNHA